MTKLDLIELLEKVYNRIQSHREYLAGHETRTRQLLIDPILSGLGWDVDNPEQVWLESSINRQDGTKRADYVLLDNDKPIAVLEAKALGKPLDDSVDQQAFFYAHKEKIKYMLVSNGDAWRMEQLHDPDSDKPIIEFSILDKGLVYLFKIAEDLLVARNLLQRYSPMPKDTTLPLPGSPTTSAGATNTGDETDYKWLRDEPHVKLLQDMPFSHTKKGIKVTVTLQENGKFRTQDGIEYQKMNTAFDSSYKRQTGRLMELNVWSTPKNAERKSPDQVLFDKAKQMGII